MNRISSIFGFFLLALAFITTSCERVKGDLGGDKIFKIDMAGDRQDLRLELLFDAEGNPITQRQVELRFTPSSAKNTAVTYESSSRHVFTVDDNGLITAHNFGRAALIVRAQDGSGVISRFDIYVVKFVTDFNLTNVTDGQTMFTGDSLRITHTFSPDDATITNLLFSVRLADGSNGDAADVLTIGRDAMLRVKGPGSVIITASTNDGSDLSKEYLVNVEEKIKFEYMGVAESEVSLKEFRKYDMKSNVVIKPENASYKDRYKFTSSDPSIAIVDESTGEVTALKTGTITIKIESLDGSDLRTSATVNIVNGVVEISRSDWSVWAKSTYSPAYPPSKAIDGDKNSFWHSSEGGGAATGDKSLPHWFLIDTKEWNTFCRWTIWRGTGSMPDMKDALVYLSPETETVVTDDATAKVFADNSQWTLFGEVDFVDTSTGQSMSYNSIVPGSTRYIKIVLPNTTRDKPTTNPVKINEFYIYKLDE